MVRLSLNLIANQYKDMKIKHFGPGAVPSPH